MPTASETSSAEAARWSDLASHWTKEVAPEIHVDRPPTERDIVVFYDPREDLSLKAADWGHRFEDNTLPALAVFAAGLAEAEAEAWKSGAGDLATRAYEARRFLVGDRVMHWAVPWLDTVGRCYPVHRAQAHSDRDFLLSIGDDMRVSPIMPGREGLVLDGEDSFGSRFGMVGHPNWLTSLWSGHLLLQVTLRRLGGVRPAETVPDPRELDAEELALLYETAAQRWVGVSHRHPGSAQIWLDLSDRAGATAVSLARA